MSTMESGVSAFTSGFSAVALLLTVVFGINESRPFPNPLGFAAVL